MVTIMKSKVHTSQSQEENIVGYACALRGKTKAWSAKKQDLNLKP